MEDLMMRWIGLAALLVACGGDNDKDTSGSDTATATGTGGGATGAGTPCSPSAGDDLADPAAGLDAFAEDCAVSPYWDSTYMVTSFFVGDFAIDDCGAVTGVEKWIMYMNPNMEGLGYIDCEVIWDVTGTLDGPLEAGTTSLQMNAIVNAGESNCLPNDYGVEIYVGEEDVMLDYQVTLSDDGSAEFTFTGSGEFLGAGSWNGNNLTYTSESGCKVF